MSRLMVLDLLDKDRAKITYIFTQLADVVVTDRRKKDLFRELRREITRHALFEEEYLYSRLQKIPQAAALVRTALTHHNSADRLITHMEKLPVDHADWMPTLLLLRDIMGAHIRLEQKELRELVPSVLKAAEIEAMGYRIRTLRAA